MASKKPWYETLFERDWHDLFWEFGPSGRFAQLADDQSDQQAEFLANALELPEGARVLDLCCGAGRHAVRLAQRGYRVTGLDLSAHHLRLAKAAARSAGVEAEWLRSDMREIPGRNRYDAVINMFTAFGYFETEEEDQRVLHAIVRALRPGGRFFLDTMNHDYLMRVFQESDWHEQPGGGLMFEQRRYDVHTGRTNVDWYHIAPDGKRRHRYHSLRLYTYTELAAMLARAGLTVRRTWGEFDGREMSMYSRRMMVLAEKA